MQRVVTIDIETIPAPVDEKQEAETADLQPDHLKTALNGDYGRILCVGFIDEMLGNRPRSGVLGWDNQHGRFALDEKAMLQEFWNLLKGFRTDRDRIVGHNIFDFDLKFIIKRSIIHGVRPTVDFPFARYRSLPVYDTMHEWEKWSFNCRVSLDNLSRALGMESPKASGMDGSKVYENFLAGNHQAIRDYCFEDVKTTRAIYRRMVFAENVQERANQYHHLKEAA